MYRRGAAHGRQPILVALTTRSVRWVNSIPNSTWEEKEVEDSRRRSRLDETMAQESKPHLPGRVSASPGRYTVSLQFHTLSPLRCLF
ncbi:hypothetical protein PoB_000076100 [Plakobranchus ocellatus]|uniref:Uncharacterized protein n=1 Tax=Plakobranchus ocellatus TaxID=259542 RepID=A0AAV3WVE3_9GAST|nr:hypothetical protein PoB_000076100 [Plakobranchus ocellatus]